MRNILTAIAAMALTCTFSAQAISYTAIPISQQATVDSDGDGVMDINDNAPGAPNASQIDTDNDLIGDVIDPTPVNSNPSLGDPSLGIYSPLPILPGGTASFDYTVLTTPPGAWGNIVLDFDLDMVADAIVFGALDTNIQTLSIPANLYVGSSWDLYTPGTYTVAMKAYAPGMQSLYWAYPNITVLQVPEPGAVLLIALTSLCAAARVRRSRN